MKIGNIVYEGDLVNHVKVDYVNYYNKSISYEELDTTLPTLYVGWSFMKRCNENNEIIQNADVLDNRIITNELYWECSYEEGKSTHIRGVEGFINSVVLFYFSSKYNYVNLDPVFFHLKDVDDLMDVISKDIDVMYNYKNEMLYLLVGDKITGINLLTYKFFKFDVGDMINRISERSKSIYNDLDCELYQKYYKYFDKHKQLIRYMPIILSKCE